MSEEVIERIVDNVYYYQGLPDDLDKLESYDAIKNILKTPLTKWQCVYLLKALFIRRYALFFKTGLGKTYMASAYMRALKNSEPCSKFLMFIKKSQEEETPKKIFDVSHLRSKVYTAALDDYVTENAIDKYDVIMMTHECLNSEFHMSKLLNVIGRFKAVIIDESHLLSNIEEASSAFMLYAISHEVDYVLSLTATPITTDVEQLARVLKVLAPWQVPNFKKLGSDVKNYGLSGVPSELLDFFAIQDRENLRKGVALKIKPMEHQVNARGQKLFEITKGPGAYAQADALIKIIRRNHGKKGYVYCNLSVVYKFIVPYLIDKGVRVAVANGKTLGKDLTSLLDDFRNDKYDIIISNKKEALDIDCDFVYFHEFTPHVPQVVGRGERGINPKMLTVYYAFTEGTDELDYFRRNILEISQDVEEIMGMNLQEVTELHYESI